MTHEATILWLDLEMTGLMAGDDLILEAAAIATTWDFKEIATFEGVVKNDDVNLNERLEINKAFWDQHQETRASLVEQNKSGKTLEEVEDGLLEFMDAHFSAEKPVLLGGNSVHMDRRFITANWPRLDARLHYRMLDVSAWKVVFEQKFGKRFAKLEAHRALEDIRGSIKELEYYLGRVKV